MERLVNILHLSDLHYSIAEYDQNVILQALKKDLAKFCKEERKPDLIIFSGDLVKSADNESIYYSLYDKVLEDISKITRCPESRFIFAPGNHDAHRNYIKANNFEHHGLQDKLISRQALNEAYLEGKLESYARGVFSGFFELRDEIMGGTADINYTDPFVSVHSYPDLKLDVVCFNTAWLTDAGLVKDISDNGRLVFPEAAISRALEKTKPDHARILVSHHPFSWLSEFSAVDADRLTNGQFCAHLFGHVHLPKAVSTISTKGKCVSNQAGALYNGRERYNGYALFSMNPATCDSVVHLRSFYEARSEFDTGINVCPGGVFYSSEKFEQEWKRHSRRIDKEQFRTWLASLLPHAEQEFNIGLSAKPISEVFVAPPMTARIDTIEEGEDAAQEKVESQISLEELVSSSKNFVIRGRQEYGKTTLLYQVALRILRASSNAAAPLLPIVIGFNEIRLGQNPIQRLLSQELTIPFEHGTLPQMLEEGLVVVLVDDVDVRDSKKYDALQKFMLEYPKNRFLFTSSIDSDERAGIFSDDMVARTDAAVSFTPIILKPFTRGKMRAFIDKWFSQDSRDKDQVLERVIREFVGINIPITAVNGTILLTIYESGTSAAPINRANLIERFVEHLLEKRAPNETAHKTFDFTNKVHVVAHFAAQMARSNAYVVSRPDAIKLIDSYIAELGLAQSGERLLDQLISARILIQKTEDHVAFRYRAFLEYFIASQMRINADFKAWVLEPERYLQYINEIQFYSGMVRTDLELLTQIGDRFSLLMNDVFKFMKWSPDLDVLDAFKVPSADSKDDGFEAFEKQIAAPSWTTEERDAALEAELPRDVESRQEVFRPKTDEIASKWILGLFLYSGILKNMELISDVTKREHLGKILRAWGVFTLQSLVTVPLIAKHRHVRVNGIRYEVNMPRSLTDNQVARRISFDFPSSISRLVMTVLGTEKLEKQLLEPTLEESKEPGIVRFYRTTLIADLKLSGWTQTLSKFAKSYEGHQYFLEALLSKTSDLYRFTVNGLNEETKVREVMSEMLANLRGATHKDRIRIRSSEAQRLEKKAVVRRMQLRIEEAKELEQEQGS